MKVCLVVIFNHRFDKNLPILEKLYGDRFPDIYYLVPFYDGKQKNVLPVYECSFYFQGYLPQVWSKIKSDDFSHYFFISDDLLLHPEINAGNCLNKLGLTENDAFLPNPWGVITDLTAEWPNFMPSINSFHLQANLKHHFPKWGKTFLPKFEAKEKIEGYGFLSRDIQWKDLKSRNGNYKYPHFYNRLSNFIEMKWKGRFKIPYPLVSGYSDTFIIPNKKEEIEIFLKRLEISRQMRLWVETAIPTLLLTSFNSVIFEKDTDWLGTTYWSQSEIDQRLNKYNFDLNGLLENFQKNELFIHPVKLSKWKI